MLILLCFLSPSLTTIQDRQFALVQETWIYNNTSRPSSLDDVMSPRLSTLIRDLACNHYSCRENAAELLLSQPIEQSVRALFWGSHHTNPEISNHCRVTLERSMICNHCKGLRDCPARVSPRYPNNTLSRLDCGPCFYRMITIERIEECGRNDYLRECFYEKICVFCYGMGYWRMGAFE